VAEGRGVASVAAAHHRYAAIARVAKHLEGGVQLRAQAIPHPITQTPAGTAVLDPDPGRGQHWRNRHPRLGDDVEIRLGCQIGVVDQIDAGFSRGAGRGRTARVDDDFDVVPVSLVDNKGDLVVGDGLYIAPSRVGDFNQINSPLALFAGLANELVAQLQAASARRCLD